MIELLLEGDRVLNVGHLDLNIAIKTIVSLILFKLVRFILSDDVLDNLIGGAAPEHFLCVLVRRLACILASLLCLVGYFALF